MGVVLAVQYPAPWKDMPPETRGMMKRMSGRVSGLLDDLSDAMSLLTDIMPSRASELVRIDVQKDLSLQGSKLYCAVNFVGLVMWCP